MNGNSNSMRKNSLVDDFLMLLKEGQYRYDQLFVSSFGKALGQKIQGITDFVSHGIGFTLVGRIPTFLPQILEWFNSEEFQELFRAAAMEERERVGIEGLQLFLRTHPEALDSLETEGLLEPREQMRFVAYLVFAIHAYLESYVDQFIQHVAITAIENYTAWSDSNTDVELERLHNLLLISGIKTRKGGNLLQRLDKLLEILNEKKRARQFFRQQDLMDYRLLLKEFIDFRNEIAHAEPFPTPRIVEQYPMLQQCVEVHIYQGQKAIEESESSLEAMPDIVQGLMKKSVSLFEELIPAFAYIAEIPRLAIIYAAFVERIVVAKLEESGIFLSGLHDMENPGEKHLK